MPCFYADTINLHMKPNTIDFAAVTWAMMVALLPPLIIQQQIWIMFPGGFGANLVLTRPSQTSPSQKICPYDILQLIPWLLK